MTWPEIREAWAAAMRDGGEDPWMAQPLQTLGGVRAFHAPGDGLTFVAVVVSVETDGVLLTLHIDGHPYLFRHDDFIRLLEHSDAL